MSFLWVCGKHRGEGPEGAPAWDFQGVFSEEALAVAACVEICDFIAPVLLNQQLPQEGVSWPGCYYPLARAPSAGVFREASPPSTEAFRDFCTDPDNCRRCKAPDWDQENHSRAGLPLGRQKP